MNATAAFIAGAVAVFVVVLITVPPFDGSAYEKGVLDGATVSAREIGKAIGPIANGEAYPLEQKWQAAIDSLIQHQP